MDSSIEYLRPAGPHITEIEIRKSRFICNSQPVTDRQEALRFIESVRAVHPKANHHCWAYIAGTPEDVHQWNSSDDGEPKGTAGQPIFNVLHHSHFGNICAVVTRYFGGIKLGTGGIARAYSQAVQANVATLPTLRVMATVGIRLTAPYHLTGDLEQLIGQFKLSDCDRHFGTEFQLTAKLESNRQDAFRQALAPFQHLVILKIS